VACHAGTSSTVVITRLDRVIQYPAALVTKRKRRGVLDHPHSQVMTSWGVVRGVSGNKGVITRIDRVIQ
jgi:hypothetical protein